MMVIDFHVHVGTRLHWTPWVIQFFRETNPYYYANFSDRITPEGMIDYLRGQGIHRAVVLSEYAPETSGVVTNGYTAAFCAGHEELIPFGSVCLYEGAPVAEDFPSLKIILDHGGRSFWYDRADWMITRHRNVYIGIAGVPAKQLLTAFPHP